MRRSYDLKRANELAASRRLVTRTGYRSIGQLVRAYCPRWTRRHG